MSQYNYVVTACEPGSIIGILKVDLFGDGINRLLAIRARSFDIYEVEEDNLFINDEVSVNEILDLSILRKVGTVETYKDVLEFDKWRPKGQEFDDVLILTREYELIMFRGYILHSSTEKVLHLHILDNISLYRENLRKSQLIKMMVHSEKQRIIILAYEGCLQVIGCDVSNKEDEVGFRFTLPIILRLSELMITDICLLLTTNERSLLAILYDSGYSDDPRLIKIIELPLDLRKWSYNSTMGLALPEPLFKMFPFYNRLKKQKTIKGLFLFGDGIVEYRTLEDILPSKTKNYDIISNSQNLIRGYFSSGVFSGKDIGLTPLSVLDIIDLGDHIRWLVLDNMGRLFMMIVKFRNIEKDEIEEIKLDILNQYPPFSRIIQISDNLFFLASKLSDSLILYFHRDRIYTLETISNIGPIRDLLFTNNQGLSYFSENKNQEELDSKNPMSLIAACGFGYSGGLKTICNGIALQNLYFKKDNYVDHITNLFSLNEFQYLGNCGSYIIATNIKETNCFEIKWISEKNLECDFYKNRKSIKKKNFKIPNNEDKYANSHFFKKYFLSLEEIELNGLEKKEETIKICLFKDKYWFQVTPNGLFSLGEASLKKSKWLLKEQFTPKEVDQCDDLLIEKFDYYTGEDIVVISTSEILLICQFDENQILKILSYKKKQELIELTLKETRFNKLPESRINCDFILDFNDKINENSLLYESISKKTDEICILGLFVIEKFVLLFIGTWFNGGKLSCFYFKNPNYNELEKELELEILNNIETEFKEYETMITSLKIFKLKRDIELMNQEFVEQSFICLIIGTTNGYLQLQYISIEDAIKSIEMKSRKLKENRTYQFKHYNTWKTSNYYISDIYELNISENSNRHFFICCDQPKILFWNSFSGRGKPGIGTWTFFNVHSSWISMISQVIVPLNPSKKNDCSNIKKRKDGNKTYILYISHEEKEDDEIQIDELKKQNSNDSNGIFITRKTNKQTILKLSLIDTLQRYNFKSIPLEFTPEKVCYIENLKIYVIVGVIERYKDEFLKYSGNIKSYQEEFEVEGKTEDLIFIQSVLCLVSAKDLKIHYSKILEVNVYPTCVEYVKLQVVNKENELKSFLAVGTSKIDGLNENSVSNSFSDRFTKSDEFGRITLYSILDKNQSYELVEITHYNTDVAPFVLKEFKQTQLLATVENSLISFELHSIPTSFNLSSSSSSSSENIWMEIDSEFRSIELRKKEIYSTHTMIVFIKIWKDEFLLVGDLMRSVGLWEFDKYTGKFHEVCRDSSIAWVIEGIFLNKNMYLISDENRNLRILMRPLEPNNDEANTSLCCIAHYHVGESITTFQKGKFMLAYPETKQSTNNLDCMEESICKYVFEEQIAFGTSQGGIYLIFNIRNDTNIYTQLVLIEEAIINTLKKSISGIDTKKKVINLRDVDIKQLFIKFSTSSSFTGISCILGGKGSLPFRWVLNSTRESYNFEYDCTGYPRGFICGDVIESFLEFSTELQESVVSELRKFKTNTKFNLPESTQQLEMIIEQLRNMH